MEAAGCRDAGLLAEEDLVVLDDDRGMLPAENVVPYARSELVEQRGEGLRVALDQVSEELTTEVVAGLVADGHRVANHSWSHPSLAELSRPAFDQEIGRTQDVIQAVTGRRPTCLRPPYGAMGSETRSWAAAAGLEIVLWDIDPQDWAQPGVDSIVRSVVDYAQPGDVVLFHDGGGNRDQTVAALERILDQLSARGFAFTIAPGC